MSEKWRQLSHLACSAFSPSLSRCYDVPTPPSTRWWCPRLTPRQSPTLTPYPPPLLHRPNPQSADFHTTRPHDLGYLIVPATVAEISFRLSLVVRSLCTSDSRRDLCSTVFGFRSLCTSDSSRDLFSTVFGCSFSLYQRQ